MEQETQTPVQQPELQLSDLQNLRSIVDVASRRGAFSAAEMSSVGAVYDKLSTFLDAALPQTQNSAEQQPQASNAQ
jgi:hypothetical protein